MISASFQRGDTQPCTLCLDDVKVDDFVACPGCRYRCCATCAAMHVQVQNAMPIRCPNAACHLHWTLAIIQDMDRLIRRESVRAHLARIVIAEERRQLADCGEEAGLERDMRLANQAAVAFDREHDRIVAAFRAREKLLQVELDGLQAASCDAESWVAIPEFKGAGMDAGAGVRAVASLCSVDMSLSYHVDSREMETDPDQDACTGCVFFFRHADPNAAAPDTIATCTGCRRAFCNRCTAPVAPDAPEAPAHVCDMARQLVARKRHRSVECPMCLCWVSLTTADETTWCPRCHNAYSIDDPARKALAPNRIRNPDYAAWRNRTSGDRARPALLSENELHEGMLGGKKMSFKQIQVLTDLHRNLWNLINYTMHDARDLIDVELETSAVMRDVRQRLRRGDRGGGGGGGGGEREKAEVAAILDAIPANREIYAAYKDLATAGIEVLKQALAGAIKPSMLQDRIDQVRERANEALDRCSRSKQRFDASWSLSRPVRSMEDAEAKAEDDLPPGATWLDRHYARAKARDDFATAAAAAATKEKARETAKGKAKTKGKGKGKGRGSTKGKRGRRALS